jgi:hypothetical protein
MDATEAELGPQAGETGAKGNEKCPGTQQRRSNIRHGNGRLVQADIEEREAAAFKAVSPTHNDQTTVLAAREK